MAAEADYSHLPTDILRIVFGSVFGSASAEPGRGGLPWDLLAASRQWLAIRLTCKHWDEVLCGTPPPIRLELAPAPEEILLNWLQQVPIQSLGAPEEGCWSTAEASATALADGGSEERTSQQQQQLSPYQMLLGLEGVGQQPFWSLAALQQLQVLHICVSNLAAEEPLVFSAASLQGLTNLVEVRLGQFAAFELSGLPSSLERLSLWYDRHSQFSMPVLPAHVRLQQLKVSKLEGVLGLALGTVWDTCHELVLVAPQVMLGVPCAEALVRQFERPYREGIYVPPHILADMDALEHSHHAAASCAAKDFFDGVSHSKALQVLHLGGGCGGSGVKFVPMRPGDLEALPFIFRSQPAGIGMVRDVNYLFEVTAWELEAHGKAWQAAQEALAAEGEVAKPGLGGGWPVCVVVREGYRDERSRAYDIPVVRVSRHGQPSVPSTCTDDDLLQELPWATYYPA
ncbi:hypothetical protein N2152v2_003935 [Parachlorella kessleri]